MKPNLVGIYITDNHIDLVVGGERSNEVAKFKTAPFDIVRTDVDRFWFDDFLNVEKALDHAVGWINERVPEPIAIGIGCYGPFETVDPDKMTSPEYGKVLQNALARRLRGINVVEEIRLRLPKSARENTRLVIDTDVNAAALGELYNCSTIDGAWTHDWKRHVIAFLKVSYGIGGGIVQAGEPWRGRLHPEMGQIPVQLWVDPERDNDGVEHQFAQQLGMKAIRLESLASLSAIKQRFSIKTDAEYEKILKEEDHPAWERQAWYLGQLCLAVTSMLAPSRIVLGGRIMNADGLLEKVRDQFGRFLGEPPYPWYEDIGKGKAGIQGFIAQDSEWTPAEGDAEAYVGRPGIIGALCMAAMYSRDGVIRPRTLMR